MNDPLIQKLDAAIACLNRYPKSAGYSLDVSREDLGRLRAAAVGANVGAEEATKPLEEWLENYGHYHSEDQPLASEVVEELLEQVRAVFQSAPSVGADVGADFVIVPKEPTAAMLEAGREACLTAAMGASDDYLAKHPYHTETARYRAMIQAALPVGADVRAGENPPENSADTSII